MITSISRQRFHDETDTVALGTPTSGVNARVSYMGYYYDLADRTTAVVDVGTNGGSAWTRPGTVPSRSDTVLVTSTTFDDAGRVYEVTDPKGIVSRTLYDSLGRTTKTIENYVDGTVSDADDKTTEYTYNSVGMTSLTAKLTGGGGQTTAWVYGVTQSGSGLDSNDIVGATNWPDPTTGEASSSEQELVTVNALGQTVTSTDRNGSVHTLSYDVLGRVISDAVTTLGSGVDGAVRRIETAYDGQGNAYLITSYDTASGGSVVNQVQREFNGLGQLITEYQEHGGAVSTSTSPKVQYAYSEMPSGANHSRLVSMTYPSGWTLTFDYGTASDLNDRISRLESLKESSTVLEGYEYLGLGTVVVRSHPVPDVDLTYVKRSGESNGDAGDPYIGLDRFGRVVDQRWLDPSSGTATDRFQYTYDRNGNRTARTNLLNSDFDETYGYDGLNQLIDFDRDAYSQDWDYDALGNWSGFDVDGTPQTRTHNAQNEITSISSATTPTYDATGNMTGDETGNTLVYDAWNRLVAVEDGQTTLTSYQYDGLNRRITADPGTARDFYYSAAWQVLEEQVSGETEIQYVWSPVYIDAMVLRDRDTDANGSLDERLWVQQDANWNVTALVGGNGAVVERYAYEPFGNVAIYSPTWGSRTSGLYAETYFWQGTPFDSISGTYNSRNREVSPTLGRPIQMDMLQFEAGDVNLYRWEGNAPTNRLDPTGLDWNAEKVWKRLTMSQQVQWCTLYTKGWRIQDKLRGGVGLSQEKIIASPDVSSEGIIGDLLSKFELLPGGRIFVNKDSQWDTSGDEDWEVNFQEKRIWINTRSNSRAEELLKMFIPHLHKAGKAAGWPANASKYDVDVVTGDTTGDAFKSTKAREWMQVLIGDASFDYPDSISIRRLMLTLYRSKYNSTVAAVKGLVSAIPKGVAPGKTAGPIDWFKIRGAGQKINGALAVEAIAASLLSAGRSGLVGLDQK